MRNLRWRLQAARRIEKKRRSGGITSSGHFNTLMSYGLARAMRDDYDRIAKGYIEGAFEEPKGEEDVR